MLQPLLTILPQASAINYGCLTLSCFMCIHVCLMATAECEGFFLKVKLFWISSLQLNCASDVSDSLQGRHGWTPARLRSGQLAVCPMMGVTWCEPFRCCGSLFFFFLQDCVTRSWTLICLNVFVDQWRRQHEKLQANTLDTVISQYLTIKMGKLC